LNIPENSPKHRVEDRSLSSNGCYVFDHSVMQAQKEDNGQSLQLQSVSVGRKLLRVAQTIDENSRLAVNAVKPECTGGEFVSNGD
jgi:hypothetical protein